MTPRISANSIFPLARIQLLEEFRRYCDQISKLLYLDLVDILENCDCHLHTLSDKVNRIMDGSMKRDMTDWWLKIIESEVNDFLVQHDYVVDAVPEDYTNRPPRDTAVVLENLRIVKHILNPAHDAKYGVTKFVSGVKDMIYTQINSFVEDCECVLEEEMPFVNGGISSNIDKLMDELNKPYDPKAEEKKKSLWGDRKGAGAGAGADTEASLKRIRENRSRFFIHGMLKDLSYLYDMKKMDDKFGTKDRTCLLLLLLLLLIITNSYLFFATYYRSLLKILYFHFVSLLLFSFLSIFTSFSNILLFFFQFLIRFLF